MGMAKYAGSIHPDFKIDYSAPYQEQLELEEKWLEKVKEGYRKLAKGDLVGEEVRFPIADGYARYMVTKQRPLTVVHLEVGDAWQAHGPTIRGLNLADVRARVEADRKWRAHKEAHEKASQKFYEDNLGKMVHYHDGFGQFIRCEVVRASEDVGEEGFHNLKKGDLCLKETALVGKWRSYDLHSDGFHMKGCREGRLMRPNLSNVYEFSKDLQRQEEDPRGQEPCVIQGQQEMFG